LEVAYDVMHRAGFRHTGFQIWRKRHGLTFKSIYRSI
jgi:hypothetical protein